MRIEATRRDALELLHRGVRALAEVERAGIRIDERQLERVAKKLRRRIDAIESELRASDVWRVWERRFRGKANLDSRFQLAQVLESDFNIDFPERTATGRPKCDEEALAAVDLPFCRQYIERAKCLKVLRVYIEGFRREVCGGFIHPVFSLHLARSYRSSSDSPNFQNLPIRSPEYGRMIRSCVIPRAKDRHIVEIDYKGIEVRVSACNHRDPVMIRYIKNPATDMHRDMAAKCYKCSADAVSKEMRQMAKGRFVFAQFYGDWWLRCAKMLWEPVESGELRLADGTLVRDWLASKGIERLGTGDPERVEPGTFEAHIKAVEEWFWGERFRIYGAWKRRMFAEYQQRGYVDMLTGFRVKGYLSRNDVSNYVIQGPAFHCLLWSLIELLAEMRRRCWKAEIVGQIHDSIVADVPAVELAEFIRLARDIMTRRLRRVWKWIAVPLEVEVEVAPEGASWFAKRLCEG